MKIKILAFTLLFLVLFSVTALAATPEENNISLSFDKDYLVITQDNISENKELIENGIRYVYQMDYNKNENKIIYTKFEYDNPDNILEKIVIDSITGKEIK